jgi:hypothetical protein
VPTISIASQLRANDPASLAITPKVSGIKIRGANVVTVAATPLVLTKNVKRKMRWHRTVRDVNSLLTGDQAENTSDVPTIVSVLPGTSPNDGSVLVTITGTGFEVTAGVVLVSSGGAEVAVTNVTRISATQITFNVPGSVSPATYGVRVTDTHMNVTAPAALVVTAP